MEITDLEFSRIVEYVRREFGINLTEKRTLITGRMDNFLKKKGYSCYGEFMDRVEMHRGSEEEHELINLLTTNHTYFLREPVHFDYLKDVVLPWICRKERATHDMRIWSAASSSGEEAYTAQMVINDYLKNDISLWNTDMLATDISAKVLEKASTGVYPAESIEKLPQHWKQLYFEKDGDETVRIAESLRKRVIFRTFNLMDPFPFRRKFHCIFLRNVMIYFEDDTKKKLLDKIYESLEPGGFLFIGTTESIDRGTSSFEYIQPSIYRKGAVNK